MLILKFSKESSSKIFLSTSSNLHFILNYNFFDVTVSLDGKTYTIAKNGGVKVSGGVDTYFDVNK